MGEHSDKLNLDCGIELYQLAEWIENNLNGSKQSEYCWSARLGDSLIEIGLMPLESRTFGKMEIPRTQLTAQGDQRALNEFWRRFKLRFASAGG